MKYNIRDIAAAKGLNIKELAQLINITSVSLYNIVNYKVAPSVATLEKIAAVLGVSVASLFADYDQPLNNATPASCAPSHSCPNCGAPLDITISIKQ